MLKCRYCRLGVRMEPLGLVRHPGGGSETFWSLLTWTGVPPLCSCCTAECRSVRKLKGRQIQIFVSYISTDKWRQSGSCIFANYWTAHITLNPAEISLWDWAHMSCCKLRKQFFVLIYKREELTYLILKLLHAWKEPLSRFNQHIENLQELPGESLSKAKQISNMVYELETGVEKVTEKVRFSCNLFAPHVWGRWLLGLMHTLSWAVALLCAEALIQQQPKAWQLMFKFLNASKLFEKFFSAVRALFIALCPWVVAKCHSNKT